MSATVATILASFAWMFVSMIIGICCYDLGESAGRKGQERLKDEEAARQLRYDLDEVRADIRTLKGGRK